MSYWTDVELTVVSNPKQHFSIEKFLQQELHNLDYSINIYKQDTMPNSDRMVVVELAFEQEGAEAFGTVQMLSKKLKSMKINVSIEIKQLYVR